MQTLKDGNGGNYRIIRSLRRQGDDLFFTPCERCLSDEAALIDALHGEILSRLALLREICVKVTTLPMTNRERNECQERVEQLIMDIDRLAGLVEDAKLGDEAMGASILSKIEAADESILSVVNRIGAIESDAKSSRLRQASPKMGSVVSDSKFDAWMKSILGDPSKDRENT